MSQNPSLQQNAQFYPPQQQFIYQQTEQRYAQLPMHPNQATIYMQPMAAPAIGPPHQQMHPFQQQEYQQHQSTHPGPNYAPHAHPPQQLLANMAAHGGQQIAGLIPFNMMGMDGPPPMVSAPAHQQQPQHFHSHQQQPHLPPQSAPPPYHNQSSNFVPASKPKVNPSIPFFGGNHVDVKGNGPHQQMHPFHQQEYQQHQSTYPGPNYLSHAHPPPPLLAPHGGQQIAGVVSSFGMMNMNMDTPPPMVPAPAHQQQHFYSHQQQHHMPPQSAPPSHNAFIPTSKAKTRSLSIQPAENTGAEEGGGGNNVDGKEGNEALENGRNDEGGQQTPVDGRNSSTTDTQQTKTTPSSMETKEENKHPSSMETKEENKHRTFYGARSQDVRTYQCGGCNTSGHRLMQNSSTTDTQQTKTTPSSMETKEENKHRTFYGARSQNVRIYQCVGCNTSGHRLMQCPESKVEREELHKFAKQFEKQAHHPALQEPKEMTSSNRAPYQQRHSQEGGRGGGGDYHHHHHNPQQQNYQHKRFGSGGGGGNRYSNNNAFGGGRDGGGGIRASKGYGGGNYRPNAQQ